MSETPVTPVAVIGMGCRLPGGIDSPAMLWEALLRGERLRRLISDRVTVILRRTIDPDRPLAEYGQDSLGNPELRTQIKAETGIRITATDIITIQGLAGLLCKKLTAAEAVSEAS